MLEIAGDENDGEKIEVVAMIAGIILISLAILQIVFRQRVADFFAWFHREAPGGGGDQPASSSTPRMMIFMGIQFVLFGIFLILRDLDFPFESLLPDWNGVN